MITHPHHSMTPWRWGGAAALLALVVLGAIYGLEFYGAAPVVDPAAVVPIATD